MTATEQALEVARNANHASQAARQQAYAGFVDTVSRGEEFDPNALTECLAGLGIDFATFEGAVKLKVQRAEWAAVAATLSKERERAHLAQVKIKQVNADFDAKVTELRIEANKELAVIGEESRIAENAVRAAVAAADHLRNTSPPERITRAEDAGKRVGPYRQAVQKAQEAITENEGRGSIAQSAINNFKLLMDDPKASTLLGAEVESMRMKRAQAEHEYKVALSARPEFETKLNTCLAQLAAAEKEHAAAEAALLQE